MDTQDIWQRYFSGRHDAVLRAGANAAEIMHITGLSLVALGRFQEAETLFTASLHANPNPVWYTNASIAFLEAGEASFAMRFATMGIREFGDAGCYFAAGNATLAQSAHQSIAADYFREALRVDPDHWEAAMNLANTLRRQDKLDEAITFYEQAMRCVGQDVDGLVRIRMNLAVTLSDMGHDDQALAIFDELAASGAVMSPEMDFNRATLRLRRGDYEQGWWLYQSRWSCPMSENARAEFKRPLLTDLRQASGKTVLFCHEQGYGDAIQFFRYAELLKDHCNVIVHCPEPLRRLFTLNTDLPVVTTREVDYDFECPMLSAPMLLGTTLDTVPSSPQYLFVPPELRSARALPSSKNFKVGLVWAGQMRDTPEMAAIDRKRSIDAWAFHPLVQIEGADFYSLQFGERKDEWDKALRLPQHKIAAANVSGKMKSVLAENFDFLDTAAVIDHLDLVITVDTSVAHLAAAMGKPTWILSRKDGCWRWLRNRADSPWYPSVRLFHQEQSWEETIQRVADALKNEVSKHHPK